ncbi:hypothetical protein NLB33_04255 [Mycolicibacterium smegmatis]|uniref:hypothetical protein n=1 Tax=Mycolicibacterium smegmatis TaxID=1772 RepID=UPI0020A4FF0F|nr:hypothetical protein [Mycolicibacterium smegmatis]MCP2622065.1 hypothetical protein [Mycolicibacterium smegmatis]
MSALTTDAKIRGLIEGLHDMAFDTEKARDYLRFTLQEGCWRDYRTPNGVRITHADFYEFVTALSPHGLSTAMTRITPEGLRVLAAGDRELTAMLGQALGTVTDPAAEASLIATDLRNRLAPEVLAALRVELVAEGSAA